MSENKKVGFWGKFLCAIGIHDYQYQKQGRAGGPTACGLVCKRCKAYQIIGMF